MRTLIEISDDLLELAAQLDALDGDVTQHQDLLDAYLSGVGERDVKLDSYAALIRDVEARAEVRKAEARRMAELARIDEAKAEFLRARLRHFFQVQGLKTVHTQRFRISHAMNGGALPVVLGVDPEHLPPAYRREKVTYAADLDALRAALDEAGGEIVVQEIDEEKFRAAVERGEALDFAFYDDSGEIIQAVELREIPPSFLRTLPVARYGERGSSIRIK